MKSEAQKKAQAKYNKEKVIAFEDKAADRIGYIIARMIISYRKLKVNVKIRIAEKAVQMLEEY